MCQQGRRPGKWKQRMKLSLPPKFVEKLICVLVISLCKIFIPSYAFDALLCRKWPFSPPNRLTLRITLMYLGEKISFKKVHCTYLARDHNTYVWLPKRIDACKWLPLDQGLVGSKNSNLGQLLGQLREVEPNGKVFPCISPHPSLVEGQWLLVHWGPFCGVRIRADRDWWGKGPWTNQGVGFGPRFSPSGHFKKISFWLVGSSFGN